MSAAPTNTATQRSLRAARQARAALSRASRRAVMAAAMALGASLLMAQAQAAPAVGQKAPDFVAVDTSGQRHKLSDFAGKYVVLEWTNPGCPFVRKHYGSGNMPATQKTATDKGVVWLAVNSTERAASDYLAPDKLAAWMKEHKAAATAVLMDEDGMIGQAYGARTTPHLFIIDPQGTLVYAGGIDSIPSARASDIAQATNYVNQALGEAFGGKTISAANTKPYGCTIKYKA
ncbi:redoxin domain-containing protein [Xenophilus arseniciresistens]|uniref:Redoxin domain-containing protein n=1 Tax=Xenophilus arseniciresistens TaxID=1283306 RepID=A0AAE3N920_9BURK|nr:redoxin domain-containing protein [Xenophilus arseniciresistens]MDA7417053.1 redoxin domain-containing protein [Xenophilus arseniciresistens]